MVLERCVLHWSQNLFLAWEAGTWKQFLVWFLYVKTCSDFLKMLSFKVVEMNDSMVDTSAGQFFHHAYTVVNQQQTPRIQGRHWGVQD